MGLMAADTSVTIGWRMGKDEGLMFFDMAANTRTTLIKNHEAAVSAFTMSCVTGCTGKGFAEFSMSKRHLKSSRLTLMASFTRFSDARTLNLMTNIMTVYAGNPVTHMSWRH